MEKTCSDDTALSQDITSGNLDIVKYLVKHGANFNDYEYLITSFWENQFDIFKYLLEQWANFSIKAAAEENRKTIENINNEFKIFKPRLVNSWYQEFNENIAKLKAIFNQIPAIEDSLKTIPLEIQEKIIEYLGAGKIKLTNDIGNEYKCKENGLKMILQDNLTKIGEKIDNKQITTFILKPIKSKSLEQSSLVSTLNLEQEQQNQELEARNIIVNDPMNEMWDQFQESQQDKEQLTFN